MTSHSHDAFHAIFRLDVPRPDVSRLDVSRLDVSRHDVSRLVITYLVITCLVITCVVIMYHYVYPKLCIGLNPKLYYTYLEL